jgi:hypothetical protein
MVLPLTNVAGQLYYPLTNLSTGGPNQYAGITTVPTGVGISRGFNTLLVDTPVAGQGTQLREMRIRDVADYQKYLDPDETPFTSSLSDGGEIKQKRAEWAQGHLTPHQCLIGTTGFNGIDNTVNVDIDVPGRIHPGSTLLVQDEMIWVHPDGVSSTGLAATRYSRGMGGSTISAHGAGVKVEIMMAATLENQDTPFRGITRGRTEWNAPQMSDVGIWGSDRELSTPDLEFSGDKYDAYLERVMKETAILFEKTAILGLRSAPVMPPASPPSYGVDYTTWQNAGWLTDPETHTSLPTFMGGLKYFTPLAYNLGGAPINEFYLDMMIADTVERVGESNTPTKLYCGKFMRMALNSLFNSNRYATVKDDIFKVTWRRMIGTFGEVDFVYSRYIPDNELYFVNTNDITKHFYRRGSWKEVLLPSLGPYKRGRFTGDVTIKFQKTHARTRLFGVSQNPADYPNFGMAA